MQSFKEYIIGEYPINGVTSTLFKFTHSLKTKVDKKTSQPLNEHIITTSVQLFDKEMNELKRFTVKFVNNKLPSKTKFINISPKELENRFNTAKKEIVNQILTELKEKADEITGKIKMLKLYDDGSTCSVIPSEFEGELIQSTTTPWVQGEATEKTKKFEM